MSAPDRPTQERVDADLATVEGWSGLRRYPDAMVATEAAIGLAAEVRALRAELEGKVDLTDVAEVRVAMAAHGYRVVPDGPACTSIERDRVAGDLRMAADRASERAAAADDTAAADLRDGLLRAAQMVETIDVASVSADLPDPPPVVPGAWRIVGPTVLPIRAHQLLTGVHDADECADRSCPIHDPSEHHMLPFDLHWRGARAMFERICGHGVGHPDPDQVAHWRWTLDPEDAAAEAIHGCDGCCRAAT